MCDMGPLVWSQDIAIGGDRLGDSHVDFNHLANLLDHL